MNLQVIILAAGAGTRMKSKKPKVNHKILGETMLQHVISASKDAGVQDICVVVGHKAQEVQESLDEKITFVMQQEQLGTGHAVMKAEGFIKDESDVLILFGDTPLITGETLTTLIQAHEQNDNDVTVLSAKVEDPAGYGRIIRDESKRFVKSVEHKDATDKEQESSEINGGMYVFKGKKLKEALKNLTNDNAQGEYYLPDTLKIIMDQNGKVDAFMVSNSKEIAGVNTRTQLMEAQNYMQRRINEKWMEEGVTIYDPTSVYIGSKVKIGMDTVIYPNSYLLQATVVGEDCNIGPNAYIEDSKVGNLTKINCSTVLEANIGNQVNIGPYAYIRPNTTIGDKVKVGDFVEIKNSTIGDYTKASHLTYIGDSDVGQHVNFGCGTVVVNYDGKNKYRTIIEDQAFIGCNTNLISPVTIHQGAYTAAGSTITHDVEEDSLAVARSKQVNKIGWAKKKKKNQ